MVVISRNIKNTSHNCLSIVKNVLQYLCKNFLNAQLLMHQFFAILLKENNNQNQLENLCLELTIARLVNAAKLKKTLS